MKKIQIINKLLLASMLITASLCFSACSSTQLKERISKNLAASSELRQRGYDVQYSVSFGDVSLSGQADSEDTKNLIAETVKQTEGVDNVTYTNIMVAKDAQNKRVVKSVTDSKALTESWYKRVYNDIYRYPGLRQHRTKILLSEGTATVDGTVVTLDQKKLIGEILMQQPGVSRVVNNLKIGSPLTDEQLRKAVISALSKEPSVDKNQIKVNASKGIVELVGSQQNFQAVDTALATTLGVYGVIDVVSNLTVDGKPYKQSQSYKNQKLLH